MASTSTATKANINATRRAACNTGNHDMAPGSLTIIYPVGGIYHIETANQRHIRELSERLAAQRQAQGIPAPVVAAPKRKAKVARLVVSQAVRSAPAVRAPRSAASKARDARYQWLRRRLRKLGFAYVAALPGSTVLAAMEATWLLLQA
jgi:hypothetical protein